MIQFIVTIIFMLSLGTILYLVVRTLPRIEEDYAGLSSGNILDRLVASGLPEKIDAAFYGFLAKVMRRLKVVLMRFDNSLAEHLKKITMANNEKPKIDFNKINGKESKDPSGAGGKEETNE